MTDIEIPWTDEPRVAFDLETTGRDPLEARIVTASLVYIDPDGTKTDEKEWLLDPGVEIPEGAAAIHGVTTERARAEGVPAADGVREIFEALDVASGTGRPIVGHNLAYDLTVVLSELARHGLPGNVPALCPIIDSYVLDKAADKYRAGKRTLSAATAHYGIDLPAELAHTSAADCYASERLATAIAKKYPELNVPATRLHKWQIGWAAQQAASLQAFKRRKDPTVVIDGSWPVRVLEEAVDA